MTGSGASARRVLISCGEASGDLYAGALAQALRERDPQITITGFGGPRLAAAGASLIGDYHGLSVTGLVEALRVVPKARSMLRTIRHEAETNRPSVFVAIDFPDFNFRLLPVMRRLGVPIVYYVSPQLWAWRSGRLQTIKQYVDRMLVIFPFETAIYEKAGVPVTFVGHPLVDLAKASRDRAGVLRDAGLDPAERVVALLPGSRPNEVGAILPTLADAAAALSREAGPIQFLVARAPGLADRLFAPLDQLRHQHVRWAVLEGAADDVLGAADVVVTASGTATVQTALHGKPMIIVYRLSPVTYAIGRAFVRVGTYGMVNLVAGKPIVPELIQDTFSPDAVVREARALLTDAAKAEEMRRGLADVRAKLGASGASARAAEAVLAAAGSLHTAKSQVVRSG